MSGETGLYPQPVLGEDAPLWFAWGLALLGALGAVAAALLTIQSLPSAPPDYSALNRGTGQVSPAPPPVGAGGRSAIDQLPAASETASVSTKDAPEEKVVGESAAGVERTVPKAAEPAEPAPAPVVQEPRDQFVEDKAAAQPQVATDVRVPGEPPPTTPSPGDAPPAQTYSHVEGQPEDLQVEPEEGQPGHEQAETEPAASDPSAITVATVEPAADRGPAPTDEAEIGTSPVLLPEELITAAAPEAEPQIEPTAVPEPSETQPEAPAVLAEAEPELLPQPSPELGPEGSLDTAQGLAILAGSEPVSEQVVDCPPFFTAYFARDSERPTMADPSVDIAGLASWLLANPGEQITVEGHTDSVGASEYNLYLSRRRAQVIADMLVDAGVAPEQLVVRGYGESVPANESAEPRVNRRVSFSLIGREGCPSARSD